MTRGSLEQAQEIHPLSQIDPAARIGTDVRIGPFCTIGPDVVVGDNTVIQSHVTLTGHTTIGKNCTFYPGCVIGCPPQDLKYKGEPTTLTIGDGNVFREQCTAHPGTIGGGGVTRIGNHNMFMAGVHIGHDAIIGNHCILANLCLLAGHVVLEDYVNIGGHVGIHHFTTVGRHAMIGGMTKIASDVPPFLLVASTRSSRQEVRMVNGEGLKRCGLFTEKQIMALKAAYMRLYSRRARTKPMVKIIHELRAESSDEHVQYLCDFLLRSFECGRNGRYLESLRPKNQTPSKPLGVDAQAGSR